MNKLKILHLYPDLLNLYGDRGNIVCLVKRLEWRGMEAEVVKYTRNNTEPPNLSDADIVFIGGGSDRDQKIACRSLLKCKRELKNYVEDGGVTVAVCGGYQLLGKYYRLGDETIEGLDILDIYTERGENRLVGNVVLKSDIVPGKIVGFENHGGRTYIGSHTPLGKVIYGFGNDDSSGYEGVAYKNVIATYLHGPLLPKNPLLCDYVLTNAIKRKDPNFSCLPPLDDAMESAANKYIADRFKYKWRT